MIRRLLTRLLAWFDRQRRPSPPELVEAVYADRLHPTRPLALESIPIRSTKADAKRAALAYARRMSGDASMTWKQARRWIRRKERALHAELVDLEGDDE